MNRRTNLIVILALAVGLVAVFLVWRTAHDGEFTPDSSVLASPLLSTPFESSPLPLLTASPVTAPEPLPPTGTPPVTEATLEALRTARPTATPPSTSGIRLPYIAPSTWRSWALRVLALSAALAYIGFRLRPRREKDADPGGRE